MTNLLPQEEKIAVKYEYKRRFLSLSLFLFALGVLCAAVFLLPSFFLTDVKDKTTVASIDSVKRTVNIEEEKKVTDLIKTTDEYVTALSSGGEIVPDYTLISKVVSYKPKAVRITSFSILKDKTGYKVVVGGVSSDRQSLLTFKKSLEGDATFGVVDLPISNLTKNKDIPFTLSIDVKKPKL